MKDNMKIWHDNQATDPDRTKPVNFGGRKFTAIDAHYQVKQCTEYFGPAGHGWGYKTESGIETINDDCAIAWCDLTFWYRTDDGFAEFGPVRGAAELVMLTNAGKRRVDTDATKKAMTDALTKALSHLGFCADVFEGLFDDNKYVEQRRQEKKRETQAAQKQHLERRDAFVKTVEAATTRKEIKDALNLNQHWILQLDGKTARSLINWTNKQKTKLELPGEDFSLEELEQDGSEQSNTTG